jgi:hypothetical protein
VFINFSNETFSPFGDTFMEHLEGLGIKKLEGTFSKYNLMCKELLELAGFEKVDLIEKKAEYSISNSSEWWRIINGTALSFYIMNFKQDERNHFKKIHLNEIDRMIENGLNTYKFNTTIGIAGK